MNKYQRIARILSRVYKKLGWQVINYYNEGGGKLGFLELRQNDLLIGLLNGEDRGELFIDELSTSHLNMVEIKNNIKKIINKINQKQRIQK